MRVCNNKGGGWLKILVKNLFLLETATALSFVGKPSKIKQRKDKRELQHHCSPRLGFRTAMTVAMYNCLKQNSWDIKEPTMAVRWSLVSKQRMLFSLESGDVFIPSSYSFLLIEKEAMNIRMRPGGCVSGSRLSMWDQTSSIGQKVCFLQTTTFRDPFPTCRVWWVCTSVHSSTSSHLHIKKAFFHDTWGKLTVHSCHSPWG